MAIKTKCPYCGAKNYTSITDKKAKYFIVCDLDNNGCDETYAMIVTMKPEVTIWKLVKNCEH